MQYIPIMVQWNDESAQYKELEDIFWEKNWRFHTSQLYNILLKYAISIITTQNKNKPVDWDVRFLHDQWRRAPFSPIVP